MPSLVKFSGETSDVSQNIFDIRLNKFNYCNSSWLQSIFSPKSHRQQSLHIGRSLKTVKTCSMKTEAQSNYFVIPYTTTITNIKGLTGKYFVARNSSIRVLISINFELIADDICLGRIHNTNWSLGIFCIYSGTGFATSFLKLSIEKTFRFGVKLLFDFFDWLIV